MKHTNKLQPLLANARKLFTKKRVAVISGLAAIVLVAVPLVTYAQYANDISDRERLMNRNSTGIVLRDKNGEVFYEFGKINGNDDAKLPEISDIFENALIASEDQDFRQHEGYSLRGIASATYANLLNKDPTRYGGSTITQQLVKNKLLNDEKSYLRKYQEVAMAVAVERRYTKDEILEMYINSVYFGEGSFGITDAAKTYFNKLPQDLNLAESSMLVGVLPAPTSYSPVSGDPKLAEQQQDRVLTKMVETGNINEEAKKASLTQEMTYSNQGPVKQEEAQHFALMVIDDLKTKYGEETVIRSGFDVTTTLDLSWQRKAEAHAREKVKALSQAGARNAGVVAVDPKNGQVRVLVGSVDWNNPTFGKVNMATSARQPGSSFKPIYYTEAIDKKLITAATVLEDKKKTYGETYAPTNYDFKYRGNISVRNALSQSLNIPAVDVMEKVGVNEAAQTAQRMGISTVTEPQKYGLSLALGTAEVKLNEMVNAYSAFANGGEQFQPVMFTSIKDKFDNKIEPQQKNIAKKVTSPEASYLISSILSDNEARAPTFGGNLNIPNRKVAVKTGTTNDSKDAWTIGYTPSLAVGVWMGNNENEPMIGLAGSSSAGGVWRSSMTDFLGDSPAEEFKQPENIIKTKVCVNNKNFEEFFIKGTEPKDSCAAPKQEKKEEKKEERQEEEKPKKEEKRQETAPSEPPTTEEGGRGGGDPAPTEPAPTEPAPAPVEPAPTEPAPTP